MTLAPDAQAVLDFWFGAADAPGFGQTREEWFRKDEAFDRSIVTRFGALIERALAGGLAGWAAEPAGALAEIVVLDQFPRNAFRGTPKSFAGDRPALAAARRLVASGGDLELRGVQRQFVYLPFEHAEDLAMQHEARRLFAALGVQHAELADLLDWADKHRLIIERFGRFPHRNLVLGRVSTSEEAEFLKQPNSSF
jgi:uncharacterized protein (DUF924 family)